MTYAIGDPDHIEVHESIRLLFMAAGLDPDLIPGTATIGATGHVDDHNRIADALEWLDENGVLNGAATISGTTGSPTTGTGKDGKALYTWTGAGSFTVSVAGLVRILAVDGGGGAVSVPHAGGGGYVTDLILWLEPGTYTVTIGAGGAWTNSLGGSTKVTGSGLLTLWQLGKYDYNKGDGGRSADYAGVYSDISGTSVGYGGAGYKSGHTGSTAAFGGEPSGGLARANSGGGGSPVGTVGSGAAGIVKLLV